MNLAAEPRPGSAGKEQSTSSNLPRQEINSSVSSEVPQSPRPSFTWSDHYQNHVFVSAVFVGLSDRRGPNRSSTSIWPFSSSRHTGARAYGCRYEQRTPPNLLATCGSVLSLNDSSRCNCRRSDWQMRWNLARRSRTLAPPCATDNRRGGRNNRRQPGVISDVEQLELERRSAASGTSLARTDTLCWSVQAARKRLSLRRFSAFTFPKRTANSITLPALAVYHS